MVDNTDWDTENDVDKATEQWCDGFLAVMKECILIQKEFVTVYLQKRCKFP